MGYVNVRGLLPQLVMHHITLNNLPLDLGVCEYPLTFAMIQRYPLTYLCPT